MPLFCDDNWHAGYDKDCWIAIIPRRLQDVGYHCQNLSLNGDEYSTGATASGGACDVGRAHLDGFTAGD